MGYRDDWMTGEEKEEEQEFSLLPGLLIFLSPFLLFSYFSILLFFYSSILLFFYSILLCYFSTKGKNFKVWPYGKRRLFPILLRPFTRAVSCI